MLVMGLALGPGTAGPAAGRDLHVNPRSGDAADGIRAPVRTIARGVRLARPDYCRQGRQNVMRTENTAPPVLTGQVPPESPMRRRLLAWILGTGTDPAGIPKDARIPA